MPDVFFCEILENEPLAKDIFSIKMKCEEIAKEAVAGQFLHIKCGEERILRRPISICDVNGDEVRIVFEIKGEGTKWLSECKAGQELNVLGPLGNGFGMPKSDVSHGNNTQDSTIQDNATQNSAEKDKKIIVIGGGIGTPPMLYVAKKAKAAGLNVTAILGFRNKDNCILADEFKAICDDVIITTDDGSAGIQGTVIKPLTKLLEEESIDAVMSCGPLKMQKAIAETATQYNVKCQVSLEERMGCGVGACLVCACATYEHNGKGKTPKMSHVCKEGPVFFADEIDWQSGGAI